MKHSPFLILLFALLSLQMTAQIDQLSLNGKWEIIFDAKNEGVEGKWHLDKNFQSHSDIREIDVPSYREEYDTRFSFAKTTDGILIANNIFYILGRSVDVEDNEQANPSGSSIQNVVFENNLYQRKDILPESVIIQDDEPLFGDPGFVNPGGLNAEDYVPLNTELIKDKGIKIKPLPGDLLGLYIGLDVEHDYFGNKIEGLPDLGAIQSK